MKCSSFLIFFAFGSPFPELSSSLMSRYFIGAIVFSSILLYLIALILKKREQHQKELNYLRTKISSDLHDDVGTLLSGLAMQAELLALQPSETDTAKLDRIADMSRTAMSRMRDLVWVIDSRKDKWEHLIDRLYDHANDALTPLNINFELKVEGIDTTMYISPDLRQNLYLIGKEAITNVAKHSDALNLTILIRQHNGKYDMHIQDNGHCPGQEKEKAAGLGISNMKWRAHQLGAHLSFKNKNGFGIFLQKIQMG